MRERHNAVLSVAPRRLTFPGSRPRVRRMWAVTAAVAVVAIGLTGCGAGGGTGKAGASGTQVTIAKAVDTIGFTTVDVAQEKGYFQKEGVNVKGQLLGGSSTAFAALQSGSVQFVTASSSALLGAKAQGVPLQAVASLDYGVSLQLIASNTWIQAHHLAPNQPVETVMKGMAGATLGVISNTDLNYEHMLMQAAGVDQGEFKIISLKTQEAALAAMQHGQIDGFLLSPPNSYFAESHGIAQIIATLHSVPQLSTMTYDILVTDSRYAQEHPDIVKSVATAMAMADQVMAKDPASVLSVEKQHYPTMSDDVLQRSLQNVTFAPDGKMTQQGWQSAKDVAAQTGVKGASSVDIAPDGGTWTNSYIKAGDLS